MIGYPAGSESSDDVEVSSGGELEPLLTLAFSKSGSLGDEGSKNSGIDQRCSLLCAAGRGWMRTSALTDLKLNRACRCRKTEHLSQVWKVREHCFAE